MKLVEAGASHFEVFPRQYSVMVFGEHPENYESSCQVTIQGDRGMMHSISGAKWFKHWEKPGEVDRLLDAMGVKSLEGYATLAHARLMQRALRHVANVSICTPGNMAGRAMVWVMVESKCQSNASSAPSSLRLV